MVGPGRHLTSLRHWFQLMRTLRLVFIESFFLLCGVSTTFVHVDTIAVFITHVQYLAEPSSATYVVGNASTVVILVSFFP